MKRMKIVKEHGQWVAHTNGFDPTSSPFTLSFEEEVEVEPESEPNVLEVLTPAFDFPGSNTPHLSRGRSTFTEELYNLIHGRIDSHTSTVNSIGSLLLHIQA